jgi:hypothetical protein
VRRKVNPKHYQIFDLYALKNWPVEKVMAALEVTEDQVFQAKSRILKLLKKEVRSLETKPN